MAHNQRLGALGIGVEATAGTPVTPTHWLELSAPPTVKDNYQYEPITTARGRVEKSQGQKLMKKSGEGNLEVILDQTTSVIPFGMILGAVSSGAVSGGKYPHTITINNSNTAKTATLVLDRVVDIRRFSKCVLESLSLKVSDGFASLVMGFKGKASDTTTATESYTTITQFSFAELTAKFGADVAAATAAAATVLTGVGLEIKREVDMRFGPSGGNDPINLTYKTLEVTGDYSLLFESATEQAKYLANTANAMILTFTDASGNSIVITLPNVLLSNWESDNALEDTVIQSANFTAHYATATTESIRVVVTNTTATYLNLSA
ncbi:MAG: phage tail tube protein [Syntrophobacteraceae bacterium]